MYSIGICWAVEDIHSLVSRRNCASQEFLIHKMCFLQLASLVQRPRHSSLELKLMYNPPLHANVFDKEEREGGENKFVNLFYLAIPCNTNSDVSAGTQQVPFYVFGD